MTPERKRLAALLALGLAFQVLLALAHGGRPLTGDEIRYRDEAMQVASGLLPEPTFFWPPLYPLLAGGLLALFGPGLGAVWIAQAAALVGAALLLRRLLREAGLPEPAPDAALALLLLDPQWAAFAQYLWPETPHLAAMLGGAALLFVGSPPRAGRAFGAGLLFGLALLLKSLLAPFLPVLAIAASRRARRLAPGLLLLAGAAAPLLPVAAYHQARTGHFRVAGSGALNLAIGLQDPQGRADYDSVPVAVLHEVSGERDPARRDRRLLDMARATVREKGLAGVLANQLGKQYGRLLDRESFFTDTLPGGRLRPLAPPRPIDGALRAWALALWALTLALAAFGLFQPRGAAEWRAAALPLAFLAFNLALFLFLHVKTRFRVQMAPALLFFGALALARLLAALGEWKRSGRLPRPGAREALGAAAAALSVAVAFRVLG